MKLNFLIIMTILAFVNLARGQSPDASKSTGQLPPSLEERERVKKRLYPGGRDEESLQVQQQLNALNLGAAKAAAEEPADPDDHD